MTSPTMMIAIDGPAASGKGTLARRLAAHYGLRHLDTGLTYRAVAAALVDSGRPLDDIAFAVAAARALDLGKLDRERLTAQGVGEAASTPVPGALANALFDATGVRLRTAPLNPARVKAALAG